MERPPRVLLIAELCNPRWSSIPLIGWNASQALAGRVRIHLVTHVRNRENLALAGLVEGRDFTALDTAALDRPISWCLSKLGATVETGKGWTTQTAAGALTYHHFERLLWERFGEDLRSRKYDIVHRLTPLSPTIPSWLAGQCRRVGVPFVLGPLNGGLPWPKEFSHLRVKEQEWLSFVRGIYRFAPGYRSTRDSASAIIVASQATFEQLPDRYREKTVYVPENAVDPERFRLEVPGSAEPPLKVVFVGRLTPYKGADMLIEAIAPLARAGKATLTIIGDGPEMADLRRQVEQEGVAQQVKFTGWLKHEDLQHRLVECDVFGFPSVREFGGAVVLETMALGLVPVVVDYGGPGELIGPTTGFAVPLGTRSEIVARFRKVLEQLIADPSVLRPMGRRGRARVLQSFTWSAKASQIAQIYEWVLGRRDKPDFSALFKDSRM